MKRSGDNHRKNGQSNGGADGDGSPGPATAPSAGLRRPMRQHVFLAALANPDAFGSPQNKGAADRSAPPSPRKNDLLQAGHRGQVSRELDDAGCAAPIRAERSRAGAGIDRGYEARARVGGAVIAGEGVTIALREVRVGVAQIEREDLVGKADADIPGVVAGLRNAVGEGSTKGISNCGAVERIGRSEPLPAELAGDIHADAAAAERRAWCRPLGGQRCVVAPGTEVQEVRRIVFVGTDLPLVVEGHVDLGIAFIKAGAFLGEVSVDWQTGGTLGEIDAVAENSAISLERRALRTEALPTRIQVTPNAEVEGEDADGR